MRQTGIQVFVFAALAALLSFGNAPAQPERGTLTPGQGKLPSLPRAEPEPKAAPAPAPTVAAATPAPAAQPVSKVPDGATELNFDFASFDMKARQLVIKGDAPTGWKVQLGQSITKDVLTVHVYATIPRTWSAEPTPWRLPLNLAASERVSSINVVGREMAVKIDVQQRGGSLAEE